MPLNLSLEKAMKESLVFDILTQISEGITPKGHGIEGPYTERLLNEGYIEKKFVLTKKGEKFLEDRAQ